MTKTDGVERVNVDVIWTKNGQYQRDDYANEADLESSILLVQTELFGVNRVYLPVKKKIGAKGGQRNIPDGYLIDISGPKPSLYVVENELESHDPLRHIAVQILQFSLSFQSERILVKKVLLNALSDRPEQQESCRKYAQSHGFRNLDHMLEWLVFESPFAALVVIDELVPDLEYILAKSFNFGVEVLQLARYTNGDGEQFYQFDPFLSDVTTDPEITPTTEIDTVVIPARKEGYEEVFINENRWYSVRLHGSMRPQIKFIAGYQVAPVSAITHIAPVKSIEPWKESGKWVINFSAPAVEIGPIPFVKKGKVKALQNLRYTSKKRLEEAMTIDDVW